MGADPRSLGPPAALASTTCCQQIGARWRLGKHLMHEVLAAMIVTCTTVALQSSGSIEARLRWAVAC